MPRKRPRSLEAPVTTQARRLEVWAYLRADEWKKKYRYTLIDEYRRHITAVKDEIIRGLEFPNHFRKEKQSHYYTALAELTIVESNMDLMIMNEINIMSAKEWVQAAGMIDDIRASLGRLVSSLARQSVSDPESSDFGMGSVNADNKDA